MTQPSGVGSWPGTDPLTAARQVRDLLSDNGIPYVVELPDRGPGADMIGRTAAALVDLEVDLQPSGWRLAPTADRNVRRGRAFLRDDLEVLSETYDGWQGPLKVALTGPWTLAGSLRLPRGERVVTDAGACRDLVQSLGEAVRVLAAQVQDAVPGAQVIVQLDEPGLPAVLDGSLRSASGLNQLRPVDQPVVRDALAAIRDAHDGRVVLHCCAPGVPTALLRSMDVEVSLDTALLTPAAWEGVAELVESGRTLWAGAVPTDAAGSHPGPFVDALARAWHRVGLPDAALADLMVTPACGLATRRDPVRIQRLAVDAASALAERADA
ncbi:methionine synthase [Branchiibius cervicis]|uniref:Methionine synthase n=1 Tax=Branchiibius cervicis TaxID=908252 RepID=A0ABW2AQB6_9MICO